MLFIFSAVMLMCSASLFSQQQRSRPNVLFIALDDLRPQLGCYGDPHAITPNMDELAARGMVFNRAYCQQAVCSPSRTSLLTGKRPNTTKVWDLKTHFREALPDAVTLPQYFKQHGYFTQSVGKIYHGVEELDDSLSWTVPGIYNGRAEPGRYALKKNVLKPSGFYKATATERADVADTAYLDGKVVREAIHALREMKDQPFFLAVGLWKPHVPFVAPEKYWALYDREKLPMPANPSAPEGAPAIALHDWVELRGYTDIPEKGGLAQDKIKELVHGYYASTSFVDGLIGKILNALDSLGLTDKTIVILWGDHGYHLGEHNLWCKTTNFELDTRVPLILSAPGKTQGVKTDALVELVDVYPTLAELAGLPIPSGLEGTSMAPLLENPGQSWKTGAFSQFPRPWSYKGKPEIMGYSVRTGRYRYTEWRDFETNEVIERELYDHRADAGETVNLAGRNGHAKQERVLSRILNEGWREALPRKETTKSRR